ncbi:hypothetical protein ACJX0J_039722, partial [Zea mays]
ASSSAHHPGLPTLQIQWRFHSSPCGRKDSVNHFQILAASPVPMATPLIAGLAVAAAALAGRYSIQAWNAYKARPVVPRMRKFYEGGFQPTMTRREAALILGV